MVLSDMSVRRPVLATVMSLIIIAFGAIAFFSLPLRELPDVDQPVVGISVSYAGASAAVIETQITRPIEDRLTGIDGVDVINSRSNDGRSSVNITFKLDRSLDDAAADVQNAMAGVINQLPVDANPPSISKADADAQPILFYSVSSKTMDQMELSDYVKRFLADRIATVNGVASVRIAGEFKPSLRVWMDPSSLAARGLTVDDIESALRRQNIETPAGYVEGQQKDYSLRVQRSFQTPEDFARLPIGRDPQTMVRLGDVARIEIAPEEVRRVYRSNGVNAVGLGIVRQSKANSLDVAEAVRKTVADISKTLPPGTEIALTVDTTVFIDNAVHEVWKTLAEAVVLVVAVIFLFLGSGRASTIPAAVIPVCLIGVFAPLALLGFSINLLTLLALVLSIGIVVDDSIVVLENIQRRVDEGEPAPLAALHGARQVAFAVVSTSAVLVAVFTPLLFVGGYVGKLFIELAATVAGVVIISAFCSLTLTPMMCSKMLRPARDAWLINKVDEILEKVRISYGASLTAVLKAKPLVYGVYAFMIAIGIYLFARLPGELIPAEDRGVIMINMQSPQGSGYSYALAKANEAEPVLMDYVKSGEASRVITQAPAGFGGGGATDFSGSQFQMFLADWSQRKRSGNEIVAEIDNKLARIAGVQFRVSMPSALGGGQGGGGGNNGIGISLGGQEYETLAPIADRIVQALNGNPLLVRPRSNYEPNLPRVLVNIDRERAGSMGVSVQAVGRALEANMGSRRVNTFTREGQEYYVYIQAERSERSEISDLSDKFVRSDTTGQLVPLSSVVTLRNVGDMANRVRLNRLASIVVNAQLPPGGAIGPALAELERVARQEIGGRNVTIDYVGNAKTFKDASGAIVFSFCFALVIVFLVLAAQFESFVHPLIIMLTVPLAVTGGLFGLFLFGSTLNIYSQIGVIILIALAAKNGILIVEFANQLRDKGESIRDAVINASQLRLRPILMTSAATMIGAMPLIIGHGAGAESRRTIGVVIVFGVLLAVTLTLFVVPVFYDLLAKFSASPEATRKRLEGMELPEGAHAHPAE